MTARLEPAAGLGIEGDRPYTVASAKNLVIDLLELGDSERAQELDERMGRSEPGRSVGGRRRILANPDGAAARRPLGGTPARPISLSAPGEIGGARGRTAEACGAITQLELVACGDPHPAAAGPRSCPCRYVSSV
jgi:hypothetical protein